MKDAITRIADALERIADTMAPLPSPESEAIALDNEMMLAAAEKLGRLTSEGTPIEQFIYDKPDASTISKLFKRSSGTVWRYPNGGVALAFDGEDFFTIDLDTGVRSPLP